jgi:hypothetical protein
MSSSFRARSVRICRADRRRFRSRLVTGLTLLVVAIAASACMPATAPIAGADPADASATAANVTYRSTIAPYSSLRPAAPAAWRERNDAATPQPKPDR